MRRFPIQHPWRWLRLWRLDNSRPLTPPSLAMSSIFAVGRCSSLREIMIGMETAVPERMQVSIGHNKRRQVCGNGSVCGSSTTVRARPDHHHQPPSLSLDTRYHFRQAYNGCLNKATEPVDYSTIVCLFSNTFGSDVVIVLGQHQIHHPLTLQSTQCASRLSRPRRA